MKMYSDNAITHEDINRVVIAQADAIEAKVNNVDIKQTAQIKQLKLWLIASVVFNVIFTVALRFL